MSDDFGGAFSYEGHRYNRNKRISENKYSYICVNNKKRKHHNQKCFGRVSVVIDNNVKTYIKTNEHENWCLDLQDKKEKVKEFCHSMSQPGKEKPKKAFVSYQLDSR